MSRYPAHSQATQPGYTFLLEKLHGFSARLHSQATQPGYTFLLEKLHAAWMRNENKNRRKITNIVRYTKLSRLGIDKVPVTLYCAIVGRIARRYPNKGHLTMISQNAHDRYNDRYNNDAYLAAVDGMTLAEAIELQDTAIMLCEVPGSKLGAMVTKRAALANDAITTFLALFV